MNVERALCVLLLAAAMSLELVLAWTAAFHPNAQFGGVEWGAFIVFALAITAPLVASIVIVATNATHKRRVAYFPLLAIVLSGAVLFWLTASSPGHGTPVFMLAVVLGQASALLAFLAHRRVVI